MCNKFIKRLYEMVGKARTLNVGLRERDIYVLVGRYLSPESMLVFPDRKHFLSALDVVTLTSMQFIYNQVKDHQDVLLYLDSSGYSGLHYAAMYSFDDPFIDATEYAHEFDQSDLRDICLCNENETRHSVISLLIERDRYDLLHSFAVAGLQIDPFSSEFQDIYFTWLHEALYYNANHTALYLYSHHKEGLLKCIKREKKLDPPEHFTPMDLVLLEHLSEHDNCQCSCNILVDHILLPLPWGVKTNLFSYDHLVMLKECSKLKGLTLTNEDSKLLFRCLSDTISANSK